MSEFIKVLSQPVCRIWSRKLDAFLGISSVAVVLLVLLTYSPILASYASQLCAGNKYLALMDGLTNPFRNRSLLLQSGLPIYDLKINAKAFNALESVVKEAKGNGWLSEDQKVEVEGTFYHDGKSYDVSVRIRGDLSPHWAGPKKSWRIKFGKQKIEDGTESLKESINFQGKRQINLVLPKDRDFVVAPFVNELMREAGVTVPRDQFVILRINGRMQGLYYEVEHFDEPLLASQRRTDSTILGQNDRAMHFEQYTPLGTPITSDAKYDIGTTRLQVSQDGTVARRLMEVLMEHSRNPTTENFQRARDVLDWDKYVNFRVMTTLFNTNHARFGSDNFKLYYDPTRGLLEPIPWDLHLTRMPKDPGTIDYFNAHGPDELERACLMDSELRHERNIVLWKMLDDGGKRLLDRYQKLHDRIRPLAWGDVLTTPIQGEKMDILKKDLKFNVERIHKVLSHSAANLTLRLQNPNQASIDVTALNFSGVQLSAIKLSFPIVGGKTQPANGNNDQSLPSNAIEGKYQLFEDSNKNGKLEPEDRLIAEATAADNEVTLKFDKRILPTPTYGATEIDGVHWEYFDTVSGKAQFLLVGKLASDKLGSAWTPPLISAKATNAVTGFVMPSGLINGPTPLAPNTVGIVAYDASAFFDLATPKRSLTEFLKKYPQFVASKTQPGAVELHSQVTLSETVIVPKSVLLIVQPGTDITMSKGVSVVCYGGLKAVGTADQSIRVHGDADKNLWGVFAVIQPSETVLMKYVDFSGGYQADVNGIHISGGVAVHHGDLEVAHCQFSDMNGEDGLNLKNGKISMLGCQVSGCTADGCDLDFATGTVAQSHFTNNGNDALECSGAAIIVTSCRFDHNIDKGCNFGEKAHVTLYDCLFVDNLTGMCCKDSSLARVAFCTYTKNRLAIEAMRKQPYWEGGECEVINCVLANNEQLLSEDYFARGKTKLSHSLVDVPTQFATCRTGPIAFQAPQTGDYRISPSNETTVQIGYQNWLELIGVPKSMQLPGISSELKSAGSPPQPLAIASPRRHLRDEGEFFRNTSVVPH